MNILQKLLTKIKTVFTKKDSLTIKNPKPIEENKLNELLTIIEVGDIIWAKRYNSLEQKQNIHEWHQEGPYIVVSKTIDGLICSKGTGMLPNEYKSDNFLTINCENYNLNKTTHFKLNDLRVIDDISFIKKLDHLTKEDLEIIMKNIKSKNNHYYYFDGKRKEFNVNITSGDIIKVDKTNYIVIAVEGEKIICVKLKTARTNLKVEDMQYLNYLNIVEFDKKDDLKYLATISPTLLAYTLKREKEYIENHQNRKIPQRGSIIIKNNNLNYIYGEEGENWLIFQINRNYSELSDDIQIKTNIYYTKYETDKINKKEDFTTITLAFPEEIDAIKTSKKTYKRRLEEELHKSKKSVARTRKK